MNISKLISTYLLLLGALVTTSAIASEHEHSRGHAYPEQKIQLDQGQKWSIDTSLHIGMTRIKASMEKNINAIHDKTFKAEQYSVLATELQNHLSYLFTHCKLPKKADKQLHTLLFSIIKGNEQMTDSGNERTGAIKIINALQQYPQFFDDRKWQALQH
ncbi:hypothetical protein [Colwellia sp. 12G3]|uniref:hypothetical protein n=1 Tax=Colwellia sp. 12G3 TaxID=2058299 RepID=UPI000C3474AC|nr:hypothetical protein [Colwellia sp. 12G3]PKI12813.1 hypothetical protein CXF71_18965 [Colwellia sp. 12G3]